MLRCSIFLFPNYCSFYYDNYVISFKAFLLEFVMLVHKQLLKTHPIIIDLKQFINIIDLPEYVSPGT